MGSAHQHIQLPYSHSQIINDRNKKLFYDHFHNLSETIRKRLSRILSTPFMF